MVQAKKPPHSFAVFKPPALFPFCILGKKMMVFVLPNRVIVLKAQATGEYIVLIDGDMVLHPQFIRDHIASAQLGVWVQGSRVLLTPDSTQALLRAPYPNPSVYRFTTPALKKTRCLALRGFTQTDWAHTQSKCQSR